MLRNRCPRILTFAIVAASWLGRQGNEVRWYQQRWVRNTVVDVVLKRVVTLLTSLLVAYGGYKLLLALYVDGEPLLGQHRLRYPLMLIAFIGGWVIWSAVSLVIDTLGAIRAQRRAREWAARGITYR